MEPLGTERKDKVINWEELLFCRCQAKLQFILSNQLPQFTSFASRLLGTAMRRVQAAK